MNGVEDSQPRATAVNVAIMKRRILALGALALTAAGAGPHKVVRKTAALDFTYEWPAQAVAIPSLDLRLYGEAKAALAKAEENARDDEEVAHEQKRDYNQEYYTKQWTTAGSTPRLLSLQYELGTYTGGAHPNTSYGALLWDRAQNREISVGSLFLHAGSVAALTRASYCNSLDAERRKRRGGEKLGGEFDECPKYSDLAIATVDKNRNGRFDTIEFVASPYTAGPYAEGEYQVSLPVTSQLIAAIRPEYRNSFERQRQ
jgi:hypothetical protein